MYVVFDHEAKSIAGDFLENGISYLSFYRSDIDSIDGFFEDDVVKFKPIIESAELVIGYNIKSYDLPILKTYFDFHLPEHRIVDIFELVVKQHRVYLKLDNIAQATLGIAKTAHGLDAIRFYNEKKFDDLKRYCDTDVRITHELYKFIKTNGYLYYFDGVGLKQKIDLNLADVTNHKKSTTSNSGSPGLF